MIHRNILVMALVIAGAVCVARAADKQELQVCFEQRYPELLQAKRSGKVGETTQGYVDFVNADAKSDSKLASLVEAENADRRELYAIIANETGATPEKVAEQSARRNFEKAQKGEYLKSAGGEWRQKS